MHSSSMRRLALVALVIAAFAVAWCAAAAADATAGDAISKQSKLDRVIAAITLKHGPPIGGKDPKHTPPPVKQEPVATKPPSSEAEEHPYTIAIPVVHKKGSRGRHRSGHHHRHHDKDKTEADKGSLGHQGENPQARDPENHCSACCYGCKRRGWECEKKCRICCPEGESAVCDDSPTCTCVSPEHMKTQPIRMPPQKLEEGSHAMMHATSSPLLQHLKEALQAAADKIREKVKSEQVEHDHAIAAEVAKPVEHHKVTLIDPHQPKIATASLTLTDIIIIVVVVFVVLVCCGGVGFARYRGSRGPVVV